MLSRVPLATAPPCFYAAAPETPALQMGTRCPVVFLNPPKYGNFGHKTPPDPQPLCTEHTKRVQTALKQLLAASRKDPLIPVAKCQSYGCSCGDTGPWVLMLQPRRFNR